MWVREGKGEWDGLVGRGLAFYLCFLLVSLDPEQQAVQAVLCEGVSRQSRLLGLVRSRGQHGGHEHA